MPGDVLHFATPDIDALQFEALRNLCAREGGPRHWLLVTGTGKWRFPELKPAARVRAPFDISWLAAGRLAREIERFRPAVVHVWTQRALEWCLAADAGDAPIVVQADAGTDAERVGRWYAARGRPVDGGPSRFSLASPTIQFRRRLIEHGVSPDDCVVIREAVDFGRINDARKADVRERLLSTGGDDVRAAGADGVGWALPTGARSPGFADAAAPAESVGTAHPTAATPARPVGTSDPTPAICVGTAHPTPTNPVGTAQVAPPNRVGADHATPFGQRRANDTAPGAPAGDQPVVLILPPLTRASGAFEAVWAAMLVRVVRPDLRIVVPGGGAEVERLRRLIIETRFGDAAVFCGDDFTLPELLTAADVAVFLPPGDAPTSALPWAMAAGVPIVASAVHCVTELLADRHNAWLCKPGEPRAAARRILTALESPEKARELTALARTQAYEVFGRQRMIRQFETAYENVIAGRSIGAGIDDAAMIR